MVSVGSDRFKIQVAHTAELDPAVLATARELLDLVFAGEMTDHDWEHALGGMHAIAWRGGQMMEVLERIIEAAYDIGALGATDEAVSLYEHRGWVRWLGHTSAITPAGIRPTPAEDGCIYVLPNGARLDIGGELTCDWRDGDVW